MVEEGSEAVGGAMEEEVAVEVVVGEVLVEEEAAR